MGFLYIFLFFLTDNLFSNNSEIGDQMEMFTFFGDEKSKSVMI